MSRLARSVYFDAPGIVSVREDELVPGTNEVLVESDLIGISHGTEMLFFRGPFPSGNNLDQLDSIRDATDYPIKYGYINVGRIEGGGRVFAFYPHQDRFYAPQESLLEIPESVESDDAVFYASMETAVQIVHDANPRLGETVLVVGLGVIGQLITRILRRIGITAIVADPLAERRMRAEPPATLAVDPGQSAAVEEIRELTGRRGVDVAVDTSGAEAGLQLCLDSTAPEGTIVEASWFGDRGATVRLGSAFHRRRLTIRSSQVSHLNPEMLPRWTRERRTDVVWKLIRDIQPRSLISHRFALTDAPRAYEEIARSAGEVMQVVLEP